MTERRETSTGGPDEEGTCALLEHKTDWRSIYVASFLGFACAVQYSVYFTSSWPYLEILDRKADEAFFGLVIAAYSLGQIIASPSFGFWSNRLKSIKIPMATGMAVMFVGNLMYILMSLTPSGARYAMLASRFVIGLGSGNATLVKAYASTSCHPTDRSKAVAYITGGIAFGIAIGPGIQVVFTPLGYPGLVFVEGLSLDMYTAPAYCACLLNIISVIALFTLFKESYAGILKEQESEKDESSPDLTPLPKFDWVAVIVCNITRFTQQFLTTSLETIGSPLAMQVFGFTKEDTVTYWSIAQIGMGLMALAVYIIYIAADLSRFVEHRIGTISSLGLFLVFLLLTYPWPFISVVLPTFHNSDITNSTQEMVGCNVDKFSWCTTTSQVNVWLYFVSFAVLMGISFSSMNITLNTLYGRILGPRRQGTMQGVLQMSGGVARLVGPVAVSALYAGFGPGPSWICEIAVVVVTVALWTFMYRRMVPLRIVNTRVVGVPEQSTYGSVNRV